LEPKLPLLLSEPTDLREALINLIFNSVDALPQGGTITLATRSVDHPVSERNGTDERRLVVEVRDNGVGMDEKIRQHCLEPFFSTKAHRGGTGLGLAMVYGMMQRHKGTIEIESAPGRGTCVRLTFPIHEKDSKTAPASAPTVQSNRSLNILCIDDEPQVRQLLNDCLVHFNHRVAVASGGKQGLELFRAASLKNQPYDVVITDLGMPEVDGHEVARTIKAESSDTRVVMMTGWGTMMKEDGETAPEVDAVVGKPPHVQELNELLHRVTTSTEKHS
jgi:CheY-like chemotaxis protein